MSERRVALITGASGGIGGACAVALARDGYGVGVHYHANQAGAQAVLDRLRAAGGEGWLVPFDVADPEAIDRAIRAFGKERGRIDALVAAAGVVHNQMLALTGAPELDRLWAVNLRGAYLCAKAAVRHMLRLRWGRIVFVSSVVGVHGNAGQTAYASTKAGLIGLGKSLARELAPRGITVNVLAPGLVETPMIGDLTGELRDGILQQVPLQRVGSPDDVAAVVSFLCGCGADYLTGAVLPIDGGLGA